MSRLRVLHFSQRANEILEVSRQCRSHRIEGHGIKSCLPAMKIVSFQPLRESRRQFFRQLKICVGDHFPMKEPSGSPDPNARAEVLSPDFKPLGKTRFQ